MKNKIKKWHIALMSFLTLFIAVFASLFSLRADTVDEETGEVLTDNWELGIVFYDSTVDNGKTPLTSIDWDASDSGYGEGTPRVITVQINYKNTSAVTTYQPRELEISIPNLIYDENITRKYIYSKNAMIYYSVNSQISAEITVGANDENHTGYDWTYLWGYSSPSVSTKTFKFYNTNTIEEKSNFEGSIQIVYNLLPLPDNVDEDNDAFPERYEDSCIHNHSSELQTTLSYEKNIINDANEETTEQINISSNIITFNYTRTYIHPWEKPEINFKKTAQKISSYDLLPNANDYIWVKYFFDLGREVDKYPIIGMPSSTALIYDSFPNECVVYTTKGKQILPSDETGLYIIGKNADLSDDYKRAILVGYPKTIYNETNGNLIITNVADYYGYYNNDKTKLEYLNTSQVTLNLADFDFNYSGDLYGIIKQNARISSDLKYQEIINNIVRNAPQWKIFPIAYYTGSPMTVKIGDDLLYATDNSGNYVKLNDNEYTFSEISFPDLYNGHGTTITKGKYNCELWVRYANSSEYVLYEEFTNGNGGSSGSGRWLFLTGENIVSFYFIIHDMYESIIPLYRYNKYDGGYINIYVDFFKTDIAENGRLYNFCYTQVYLKNENNELVLQNQPTFDSYANFITKDEIATFDQETYGTYMQRACAYIPWTYYNMPKPSVIIGAQKTSNTVTQDAENEQFLGSFSVSADIYCNSLNYREIYHDQLYSEDINSYLFKGFILYDLLPEGMDLYSTPEEILASLITSYKYGSNSNFVKIFDQNKNLMTLQEISSLIKNNTTIIITNNWNNTGRTKIEINVDLSESGLLFYATDQTLGRGLKTTARIKYRISYDSFLEHGNIWTNNIYLEPHPNNEHTSYINNYYIYDNGALDPDAVDINSNNNFEDIITTAKASATITSAISTHQDVTTYVKTDQSNYSTGIVDASCDSEYEYKLRVRTGSADITNLVIYTSIEEAQPKRSRWYGEFLGVDTTYAENKGYTVKVWYSPNATVGTLTEDTSWQVYDETTVDKSKVKSLAFQYLVETDDTTGTSADAIDPAVLPANSLTYVLIKMKSPTDENETRLARMDCWTQWNAIDEFDQPVDFITGINSNVVKVALPNSVKTDDLPSISLKFTKDIQGETSDFENLKLNKTDEHIFMIRLTSLTANDDGTYNQVTGLLSSTQGLVITQIPIGTYLLEELGDNYFDFVEFTNNNDPEIIINGVTFERTDQGYIITVSEDLAETVEFNIKVTNKTEDERFYEEKHNKENLFLINKTGIDHNVPEE